MDPVICNSCGSRFALSSISERDYNRLKDQHYYEEFVVELRMLNRVRAFYRRYPEAEQRIGHIIPDWSALASKITALEVDVLEYLKHHEFALDPRLRFVSEEADRLKDSVGLVPCLSCKAGRLCLDAQHWENPDVHRDGIAI